MPRFPLRIATRASPLALAQAEAVRACLAAAHGLGAGAFEILAMRTSGDRILDRPLAEAGGKGLFTKEIEEALLDGRADLAVHSAKDLPTELPTGLGIAAVLPREDPRDVFISPHAATLAALEQGAIVGTASLRRAALVKRQRPDLETVTLRGNVQTRLAKLAEGRVQATFLALAGLRRLGMEHVATSILDIEGFPPAVGQGVIAVETRLDDDETNARLGAINDPDTASALDCERAFLTVLDGSCRTPIAGYARAADGQLAFHGLILSTDGAIVHEARRKGAAGDARSIGADAGAEVSAAAGPTFMATLRNYA